MTKQPLREGEQREKDRRTRRRKRAKKRKKEKRKRKEKYAKALDDSKGIRLDHLVILMADQILTRREGEDYPGERRGGKERDGGVLVIEVLHNELEASERLNH